MLTLFLKAAVAAIVWTLANLVYVDLRRKGVGGFGRFAAFWVGTPTTWVSLFAVKEGSAPPPEATPDNEEALFDEVRRDRALRAGADERAHPASDGAGGP